MAVSISNGCSDDQPQQTSTSARLLVGTSADNPPFEFYTTTGNAQQIQGFDIDLMNEIATLLNMKAEFVDIDFNGLVPAIQTNRIAVIASAMAPTPERRNALDFSEVYLRNADALITKAGVDMTQEKYLADKKIGAQLGSTFELTLKTISKRVSNLEIVSRNRLGDLIQELKSGRIDGILTEDSVARSYVKNNSGLSVSVLEGHEGESALAFVKNAPLRIRVDEALTVLRDNGTLDKLKAKWFGAP